MKKTIISIIALLLLLSCARNPVTGKKELAFISERQEVAIGTSNFNTMQQAEGGLYTADPELVAYVREVGMRVAKASQRPHLPYEFVVINDATPNAWTLPGGKIAINRGMLLELSSEAELAAVLGHEIVHADARHGAKGMERGILAQGGMIALGTVVKKKAYGDILVGASSVGALLVHQKFGRGYEFEADRYGMQYMAIAGYDPQAAVKLQEIFLNLSNEKQPGWIEGLFASHPPTQERLDANRKTAEELHVEHPFWGKEEYQTKIAKLKQDAPAYNAYEKGKKALDRKEYQTALQYADKALSITQKDALFWKLQGDALLALNEPENAARAYTQAIKHYPSYSFYLKRAMTRNDTQEKQHDLAMSLSLLPTGEGHELMGKTLLMQGKKERAIEHLKIASLAQSDAGERSRTLLSSL